MVAGDDEGDEGTAETAAADFIAHSARRRLQTVPRVLNRNPSQTVVPPAWVDRREWP
jgi:hypothetical protein